MKKLLLSLFSLLILFSCGNGSQNDKKETLDLTQDPSIVYVYYFHAVKRCKTCTAVEKVTKETIEANYATNPNVKLLVLLKDDTEVQPLVEKYQISWNGLIIAKGDNFIDITEQAFADAINSPDKLSSLIKEEIESRL